jgi:hypothetical protein
LVEFVANVLEMLGRKRDANVYGSLRLSWLIAINGWIEFGREVTVNVKLQALSVSVLRGCIASEV